MFDSAVVLELLELVILLLRRNNLFAYRLTIFCPQKSCELGARFADLEKKQIQLNLDLELAKINLQKAKDEAAGRKDLSTDLSLNQISFRFF